jgi:hypothetical protein
MNRKTSISLACTVHDLLSNGIKLKMIKTPEDLDVSVKFMDQSLSREADSDLTGQKFSAF